MQRPQREGCAADAGGAECPEAPEGGDVSPLRRLQTTLFFVTSRALFPLLGASALVLVGAFALGGISRGSVGPLYLALGLVGLALLLTLACLVVQLLVYLAEADRQEVTGILFGAGGGALTSFACARIYPAWDVGSLLVFAVARLALTECQQPHWQRRRAVKPMAPVALEAARASVRDVPHRRRRRLPDAVVVGAGVAYGFAAMGGLGLASKVQTGTGLSWLSSIGGGVAFLFFLLSTQGLLAIVHDGVNETAARWRARGH